MVSKEYLDKIRFAVRRNSNTKVNDELNDVIEQCRADLIRIGVSEEIANNENDKLVLGCQRAFARWQLGIDPERNFEEYRIMADELRKSQVDKNVL